MKPSALTMKLLVPIGLTLSSTILLLKQKATSQRKIDENILRLRRNDPILDIGSAFKIVEPNYPKPRTLSRMPIGVRDMGFNTATNLFLMIGMKSQYKNKIVCPECGKKTVQSLMMDTIIVSLWTVAIPTTQTKKKSK